MKLLYFLSAFLLLGLFSCGDDPIVPPTPSGPQQYGVPLASVPNVDQAIIYEVNLRAQSAAGTLHLISRVGQ